MESFYNSVAPPAPLLRHPAAWSTSAGSDAVPQSPPATGRSTFSWVATGQPQAYAVERHWHEGGPYASDWSDTPWRPPWEQQSRAPSPALEWSASDGLQQQPLATSTLEARFTGGCHTFYGTHQAESSVSEPPQQAAMQQHSAIPLFCGWCGLSAQAGTADAAGGWCCQVCWQQGSDWLPPGRPSLHDLGEAMLPRGLVGDVASGCVGMWPEHMLPAVGCSPWEAHVGAAQPAGNAVVVGVRKGGIDLQVWTGHSNMEADEHYVSWSDLQPIDKPMVAAGVASARFRFHCIDAASAPWEWHSGRENLWQDTLQGWRTGHCEVDMRFASGDLLRALPATLSGGSSSSGAGRGKRRDDARCARTSKTPFLLALGPKVHVCLAHRTEPLSAFCCGPCAHPIQGSSGPWPDIVSEWPTAREYADVWHRLSFMEAVTCAVTEGDSKMLGGVEVKWIPAEDDANGTAVARGVFHVPYELMDAHKVHIHSDDLLCIRLPEGAVQVAKPRASSAGRPRPWLIASLFKALNVSGSGYVNGGELHPLARHTGFEGSSAEWQQEYADLCSDLRLHPEVGMPEAVFASFVNDRSSAGCYCSDEELSSLLDAQVASSTLCEGLQPVVSLHGVVEAAESFEDSIQVRFKLNPDEASRLASASSLRCGDAMRDCTVEFIALAQSYHYSKAALEALLHNPSPMVSDLVLRGQVARSAKGASTQELQHFNFNPSQEEAVRVALAEQVTLIHGPPGTGKTRVGAALALCFARQNAAQSADGCVLYTASGNRAVDVAAEAVSALCVERLEDLFEAQQAGEEEKCCICWAEGCNVITFCGHVFHRHCLTQALRATAGGNARRCPLCRSALKSIDGIRLLRVYSGDTERLEFPVPKKYDYQGVRERSRKAVPEEMRRFALHWRIHDKVPNHFNPHAAECASAYDALMAEGAHGSGFDEARLRYREASKKARAFEVKSCNVLLTTTASCRRDWLPEMLRQEGVQLKQVVVDEAGMTQEPEALCPLTLARDVQRVVLVGDYRQLRPVVKNRDAEAKGLGRSLFERLAVAAEAGEGTGAEAPASVLLRQQYRMHPQLNRFSSVQFYGGQVADDSSTLQRPLGLLEHPRTRSRCAALFWTSPCGFQEEVQEVATRDASTQSKANPQEADRCVTLAAELAARAGPRSVAVLSWYNAQVSELRRRLRQHAHCAGVHVGSVVTAQGSEWDYVLLSTVRSVSGNSRGASLGCLADKHLLNVAVTRGRLGIVVLGNPTSLSTCRPWKAFLEHCREVGGFMEADDDVPPLVARGTLAATPVGPTAQPGYDDEAGGDEDGAAGVADDADDPVAVVAGHSPAES